MTRAIEKKPFYVVMTDSFMSGWGMADGKTNKLVIGCDTNKEAHIVKENANCRSEMKYVNIRVTKPYYNQAHISYHDKTDYDSWFIHGYFREAR